MHILVVEDDAPLARIVKKSLESGGHTVEVAVDGQEGLDLGRQRSHDAVVLDIQLPKVNGMDVCRMLREDGNRVPIIMLTARGAVADRAPPPRTHLPAGARASGRRRSGRRRQSLRRWRRKSRSRITTHDADRDQPLGQRRAGGVEQIDRLRFRLRDLAHGAVAE